jgi:hypothetical protein
MSDTIGECRHASDLQDDRFILVLDSQNIEHLCKSIGYPYSSVTGAIIDTDQADYREVWVTGSSRPFDLSASYERIR